MVVKLMVGKTMELEKISRDEISNYDLNRLRELETDIRRELAMSKLHIFDEKKMKSSKVIGLRKNLARVLTYRNMKKSN